MLNKQTAMERAQGMTCRCPDCISQHYLAVQAETLEAHVRVLQRACSDAVQDLTTAAELTSDPELRKMYARTALQLNRALDASINAAEAALTGKEG